MAPVDACSIDCLSSSSFCCWVLARASACVFKSSAASFSIVCFSSSSCCRVSAFNCSRAASFSFSIDCLSSSSCCWALTRPSVDDCAICAFTWSTASWTAACLSCSIFCFSSSSCCCVLASFSLSIDSHLMSSLWRVDSCKLRFWFSRQSLWSSCLTSASFWAPILRSINSSRSTVVIRSSSNCLVRSVSSSRRWASCVVCSDCCSASWRACSSSVTLAAIIASWLPCSSRSRCSISSSCWSLWRTRSSICWSLAASSWCTPWAAVQRDSSCAFSSWCSCCICLSWSSDTTDDDAFCKLAFKAATSTTCWSVECCRRKLMACISVATLANESSNCLRAAAARLLSVDISVPIVLNCILKSSNWVGNKFNSFELYYLILVD